MKNLLLALLSMMLVLPFSADAGEAAAQKKKGKCTITCEVTYISKTQLPDKEPRGVSINYKDNTQNYIYVLEGAAVQLLQDGEVVAETTSDFEGFAVFKKLKEGEYTIRCTSEGCSPEEEKVVLKAKEKNNKSITLTEN